MSDDIPEEEPLEPDSLGRFTIDERFNFSVPDDLPETAQGKPRSSHLAETKGTPLPHGFGADADADSDDSEDPDALIGHTVGNYEIIGELGRGGFGSVYKAKDIRLQRFAALKFLRFPLDREYRKLFTREAQVIANLGKHTSIVQIYEWGEYQGSHYFALEYLDTSAEGLLQKAKGALPVKQALQITAECAGALHYAHENGVLHRDVKPANILIDQKSGHAKVCDFGLAKFHSLGAGTATSTLAGSPPYMAPEQIAGQMMDARTDVYSLGVTLYELLSRKLPCTGSSHIEILDRIRNKKTTPLREFRPDLSETVLSVVQRATAFRPEDRFETAEEMQQAVQEILDSIETSGSSENLQKPRRRRRASGQGSPVPSRLGISLIAAAALVAFAAFAWLGFQNQQDSEGGLWPVAMAGAKEQIEAGQYDDAIAELELYLTENPTDDFANYALGYASLLSDQLPEAETAFKQIEDEGLREEGIAAAAHARLGEESRPTLESAIRSVPTKYPGVLLASLDVLNDQYEEALVRLEAVNRTAFFFDWQRRQFAGLMGQIHYRQGNYELANSFLSASPGAGNGLSQTVNQAYDRMAKRQLDEERRAALHDQIANVKQLADSIDAGEIDPVEEWTSRPFRLRISPANPGPSRLAQESGLVDVLPELLADSLVMSEDLSFEIVDREFIGDVLYEQELAKLSSDAERIRLLRLLGARLMIESEFGVMGKENYVRVKIIDTETSKATLVPMVTFDRNVNPRQWTSDIAEKTVFAVQRAYPVRGVLTIEETGPVLNIGKIVGVRDDMKFSVLTGPAIEHELRDATVVVDGTVGQVSTSVRLVGFSQAAVAADGWYVQEIR